jgi:serine/threonine-protein kinase RsbW
VSSTSEYIALSLPSNPMYLGLLRSMVGEAADLYGFSEEEKQGVMLAVNEGCANIIRHCYQMDSKKKIDITIRILPDRMEVVLRDYGQFQDADEFPMKPCADLEPGGLGLTIMKSVMDRVEFRPAGQEGTLLTMVKYRAAESARDEDAESGGA